MFAEANINTTEQDIWNYLGNIAGQEAKKGTEKEREEMVREITLEDTKITIKKSQK